MNRKTKFIVGLLIVGSIAVLATRARSQLGQNVQNIQQNAQLMGGVTVIGSIAQSAIGTPSAPTVLPTCTGTCATTYTYFCVGTDINGRDTIPSSSGTTTLQAATLTATAFNTIQCTGKTGATRFKVLKTDTAHLLATCNATSMASGGSGCEVTDNSTTAGTAYTAQTVDQTGPNGNSGVIAAGSGALKTCRLTAQSGVTIQGVGASTLYPTCVFTGPTFADTNYGAWCFCVGPTLLSPAISSVQVKSASGIQPALVSLVAGSSACTEVDCVAIHD